MGGIINNILYNSKGYLKYSSEYKFYFSSPADNGKSKNNALFRQFSIAHLILL